MKNYLDRLWLAFLICMLWFSSKGQNLKTVTKLTITHAVLNKKDLTTYYVKNLSYLVFYRNEGDSLFFANVVPKQNSESFGPLLSHPKRTKVNQIYLTYKADYYYFTWKYANTSNSKKGTADIMLVQIHRPEGMAFSCTIKTRAGDVYEYTGTMDRADDFSKL